ncbi:MAG: type 1 glutamine amidotransferase [Haloarculaceae archaeon]
MALEFALLDASFADDDAYRNFSREFDADVVRYRVREEELPPVPDGAADWRHDGVVVSGSAASVYWDREWIQSLESWVEAAAAAEVPVLGVCFGHQLLADALGGWVESMGEYELGYHMVHHDGECRLFEGVDEWFVTFTAHSDEVVELPPGATAHARNPFSIHAFEREPMFGVQFHPEMDRQTTETVMVHRGVDGDHVEEMLQDAFDDAHNRASDVRSVFGNFESFVADWTG